MSHPPGKSFIKTVITFTMLQGGQWSLKKGFIPIRYSSYLLLEPSEGGMVLHRQSTGIFNMRSMICSCSQVASDSKAAGMMRPEGGLSTFVATLGE